ncbi:hypothetical protein CA54_33120 [Symmachiella macrocystis]|uniref:Periplasmic folding chaperone n=1 Tax=Symmachiella macrocystis TaxID=2527985 RepID=A0A5C6BTF8_9PLAN|nr:hypothetical protein [Symmachiella macrocystis]TWU14466.1 hypothetical protein CA54_33120 [Symmachiella macrocystis]
MKSPFALIRKYQKTLMVALTLLAVFAFVIADSLSRSMQGPNLQDKVVVKTSAGDLNKSDIDALVRQRQLANRFIQRAATVCEVDFRQIQQMFFRHGPGDDIQKDVLFGYLLTQKADEIGIAVADSTVQDFIRQVTGDKLSTNDFRDIVSEMHVSQNDIFNALRGELRSRTARELLSPRAPLAPEQYWDIYKKLQVAQVMEISPVIVEDFVKDVPEHSDADLQKWFDTYKDDFAVTSREDFSPGFKQPRKVELQYLTLRFADVRKQVEESKSVTDEDIVAYYEANKDIQYVIDPTPTLDGDNPFGPDGEGPTLDAPEAPKTDKPATDEPATEEPKVEEPKAEKSEKPAEGPALKTDDAEPPAAKEATPPAADDAAPEETKPEEPTAEEPATEENSDDQSSLLPSSGVGSSLSRLVTLTAFAQDASDEPAAQEPAADEPAADEPAAEATPEEQPAAKDDEPKQAEPAQEPAAETTEPKLPAPADEPAKTESAESDPAPEGTDKPETKPELEYRELDEDLKDEIRTELENERTRAELNRLAKQILEQMNDLVDLHLPNTDPEESFDDDDFENRKTREELQAETEKNAAAEAPKAAESLKKLGEKFKAAYASTGLVSAQQLFEMGRNEDGEASTEDSISDSRQAGGVALPGQPRTSTIQLAFSSQLLYGPYDVEGMINSDRFLFWKVQDRVDHVPASLADVRDEVLKSWKLAKARELAEAHAKSLVESVGNKELAKALPEGTPVGETTSFTWLYQPENVNPSPMARRPPPTISEVSFGGPIADQTRVTVADETFMKTVFDELGVFDVGVASSGDLSAYYVVRIKQRDLADPDIDGSQFMRENKFTHPALRAFMSTPYDELAVHAQQVVLYEWSEDLKKSFDVEWVNNSAKNGSDG